MPSVSSDFMSYHKTIYDGGTRESNFVYWLTSVYCGLLSHFLLAKTLFWKAHTLGIQYASHKDFGK
jgi:hypothetical protein